MAPISRGVALQNTQIQTQKQSNKDIILGPKRVRPSSAIRPTSSPKNISTTRPKSGLKRRPERRPEVTDDLQEELAVMQIRAVLYNVDKLSDGKTIEVPEISIEKKASRPKLTSVNDIDLMTQRRIVPSVEKNYLKQRSVVYAEPSLTLPAEIESTNPHPELIKRSLFVAGLRESVKKGESIKETSAEPVTLQPVTRSLHSAGRERTKSSLKPERDQSKEKTSLTRETIDEKGRLQSKPSSSSIYASFISRPLSPTRATIDRKLSSSPSPPRSPSISRQSALSKSPSAIARNSTSPIPTATDSQLSPRSTPIVKPSDMLKKKQPSNDSDGVGEDSSTVTGEDDASTAQGENEPLSFALFSIVEARYKGRSHWWTGKIVQSRLDGTYDIQFGDILERHVPASRIRVKPTMDIDKIKMKIRLTGMIASTLRDKHEEVQREDDEEVVAMEDEFRPIPVESLLQLRSPPPPNGESNSTSSNIRGLIRKTIVRVLSGSLPAPSSDNSPPKDPPPRQSLFAQISAGASKLRKVEKQMEAAAEAVAEAKRRHEIKEQQRLWPELLRVVNKARNEIAFEDVKVVSELGRGKFASVHIAELIVKLHTKVFTKSEGIKRTLERLGNNLNKIKCGVKSLAIDAALKVMEYSNAYPLIGGDWENDKPQEKDFIQDNLVYTDPGELLENGEVDEIDMQPQNQTDLAPQNNLSVTDNAKSGEGKMGSYKSRYQVMPPSKSILESLREIKALTFLQHKNIIMLHGVIVAPRLILVLERMQNNLYELLNTTELQIPLTPSQRLAIVNDVSCGLAHIHNQLFIHRDLKVHNILISCGVGGYVAKIADFGTALRMTKGRKLTEAVGTSGYTAPEVTDPGSYDIKADIFSLGILMWETFQSYANKIENPLCGLTAESAVEKITSGVRPDLTNCYLPQTHSLIMQCWATLPASRPTAEIVFNELIPHMTDL